MASKRHRKTTVPEQQDSDKFAVNQADDSYKVGPGHPPKEYQFKPGESGKPFEIPPDWPRYRAIDWGFNNPFVCLFLARDPDSRWYVYAEHYRAQETLAFHAERIKQISGRQRFLSTFADHDAQDRYEFEKLGIKTTPARKDVRLGIEAVQAVLKVREDGRPRLFIFETCKHTIDEMIGYRWAEGTETSDPKDEPLKVNDHTCDALRYAVYGVEGNLYFSANDLS